MVGAPRLCRPVAQLIRARRAGDRVYQRASKFRFVVLITSTKRGAIGIDVPKFTVALVYWAKARDMAEKVKIALCMGSSCFTRGNNRLLKAIEDSIRENAWENRVILSGLRCENRCGRGPNVFIDGKLYQGLDVGTLLDLLFEVLGRPGSGKSSIRL